MAVKARNEITLVKVVDGTDGDSGIIVSSTAPSKPTVGQLWQTATGQPIKRWTGNSWVIHYISVDNLNVDTLSAIAADLGNITGGSLNINGKFIVDTTGKITSLTGSIGDVNISDGGLSSSKSNQNGLTTSYNIKPDGTISSEQTGGEMDYLLNMDYGMIDLSATPNDGTSGSWSRHKGINISGGIINFYSGSAETVGSIEVDTFNNCIRIINAGHEQPIFELVETVDLEI